MSHVGKNLNRVFAQVGLNASHDFLTIKLGFFLVSITPERFRIVRRARIATRPIIEVGESDLEHTAPARVAQTPFLENREQRFVMSARLPSGQAAGNSRLDVGRRS